jgi:cytosine/adenosine deaminase-related metal-dependent hydrolase
MSANGPQVEVDLLLVNATLLVGRHAPEPVVGGAVAVHDGRIVAVDGTSALLARFGSDTVLDARGGLVHPGFVDAHVHLHQHLGRSVIPDWWGPEREHDHWRPYRERATEEDRYLAALLACCEMAMCGTTSFCDMGGGTVTARAAEAVGLRGIVCGLVWDQPGDDQVERWSVQECVRRSEDLLDQLPRRSDRRVWAAVGLPGLGACSDDLLRAGHDLARRREVLFYLHQSFSPADTEAYRRACGNVPAVVHLDDLGVLAPQTQLVHLNVVDKVEVDRLVGAGASVVHCPGASLRAGIGGSRLGRFPEMVACGVPVALGSDAGNFSDALDVGRQAFLAATIHREARGSGALVVGARDAFTMATAGGAHALGLADDIGTIEVGKRADLVVRETARPELAPGLDPLATLVYSAGSKGVRTVVVDGEVIVADGAPTRVDVSAVVREATEAAIRLHERMGFPVPVPADLTGMPVR